MTRGAVLVLLLAADLLLASTAPYTTGPNDGTMATTRRPDAIIHAFKVSESYISKVQATIQIKKIFLQKCYY